MAITLLAIETTGMNGTVAFAQDGKVLRERPLPADRRSAQSLAPAIHDLAADAAVPLSSLNAVAVAVGPGSFTGLRVGVTTAKILAWTLHARLFGVGTLDALARRIFDKAGKIDKSDKADHLDAAPILSSLSGGILSAGIDAERGEVAVKHFWFPPDSSPPIPLEDGFRLISAEKWLAADFSSAFLDRLKQENNSEKRILSPLNLFYEKISAGERFPFHFCGPALIRRRNRIAAPQNALLTDEYCAIGASGVALAAFDALQSGRNDDIWSLLPIYSRASAAEERLQQKEAASGKKYKNQNI